MGLARFYFGGGGQVVGGVCVRGGGGGGGVRGARGQEGAVGGRRGASRGEQLGIVAFLTVQGKCSCSNIPQEYIFKLEIPLKSRKSPNLRLLSRR